MDIYLLNTNKKKNIREITSLLYALFFAFDMFNL